MSIKSIYIGPDFELTETPPAPEERSEKTLHYWGFDWDLSGSQSASGQNVNATTAMGLTAYFAAIRAISEDVAKLPIGVYRRLERGRERVASPVDYLLNVAPNPEMTAMSMRETLVQHALGFGGGYAEIVRSGSGAVREMWPLDPTTVSVARRAGRLVYIVRVHGVEDKTLTQDRVFHLHGLGFDSYTGYSLSTLAREALGAAMAAQQFGGSFFGNGTWVGGVLEHPNKLSDKALESLRSTWQSRHGGAENAGKPAILEEDMKYKQLGIAPEQAQFIETRQFGVEEVARLFRIPPHKIGHLLHATFSNIEHQGQEYVGDTLTPWLVRWEQESERKLTGERTLRVKHNVNALLRADSTARGEFYAKGITNGWFSVNDVREYEDLNPVDGGDEHFRPLNLVGLTEEVAPQTPSPPPPPAADQGTDEGNDDERTALVGRILAAHREAFQQCVARLLRIEREKAQRAIRQDRLEEWRREFYPGHIKAAADFFLPVIRAAFGTVDTTIGMPGAWLHAGLFAVAAAQRHCDDSRAYLDTGEVWDEDRAELAAGVEIDRMAQVITEHLNGN